MTFETKSLAITRFELISQSAVKSLLGPMLLFFRPAYQQSVESSGRFIQSLPQRPSFRLTPPRVWRLFLTAQGYI